jgi:hemerythrin superfamily protein
MATSRRAKAGRRSTTTRARSSRVRARNGEGRADAVNLLKADHREVERLFERFNSARSEERQQEIAQRICQALKTHTAIEEEIFYPAFLEATEERDIHHEAEVEHEGAKRLIEQIESSGADDDHFEARVTVLEEMIRHHVKEEEQRGGMFAKAKQSDMDLAALGEQMRQRKLELLADAGDDDARNGRPQMQSDSRRGGRDLRPRTS